VDIRGEGLVLRPWVLDDVRAVVAALQDPEIPRWIHVIPQPYGEDDAREHIERCLSGAEGRQFAITDEETGELLGSIGMRVQPVNRFGHIGYWVAAHARGRGVAPRALRLLCEWGSRELGLGRIELVTDPENRASQRVAEKVGFQREGVLRAHLLARDGTRRDSVLFSLLPDELR
jgi:RimJ/RimL family protein N-acetyltransferase